VLQKHGDRAGISRPRCGMQRRERDVVSTAVLGSSQTSTDALEANQRFDDIARPSLAGAHDQRAPAGPA
jgi:hypothetical protein